MVEAYTDPSSVCWRKKITVRFESLWSLLHKFAFLNSTDSHSIREIFALEDFRRKNLGGVWKWSKRRDLRDFGALDPKKLSYVLQLDRDVLDKAVLSTYLNKREIGHFTADKLRYCKECIKKGFHSVIYQLQFFEFCPIHRNIKLISRCETCKNDIPYELSVKAFKVPYSCSCCLRPFIHFLTVELGKREQEKISYYLEPLHHWLLRRRELNTRDKQVINEPEINSFKIEADDLSLSYTIPHHWADLIQPDTQVKKYLETLQKPEKTTYYNSSYLIKNLRANSADSFGKDWNKDLYSIYKSIRRFVIKRFLRKHRGCVEHYGRSLYWDRYAISYNRPICEAANALLLWRMSIEDVNHPTTLFKKFRPSRKYSLDRPYVDWNPPTFKLPEFMLKKLYALECYWLFLESMKIVRYFNRCNKYSFNKQYFKTLKTPYWIVEIPSEEEVALAKIHWWKKESETAENEPREFNCPRLGR